MLNTSKDINIAAAAKRRAVIGIAVVLRALTSTRRLRLCLKWLRGDGKTARDGSVLRAVDSKVGRIGQLAWWESYNPLARCTMMADGKQIHSAMYPGSRGSFSYE